MAFREILQLMIGYIKQSFQISHWEGGLKLSLGFTDLSYLICREKYPTFLQNPE